MKAPTQDDTAMKIHPFDSMSRCGAKRRNGLPCKRIGNKRNGRCRLHGGNAGAPSGERNGRFRHGGQTKEAQKQRRAIRRLIREAASVTSGTGGAGYMAETPA